MIIPSKEIKIKFSKSSGPGGQNVNKRETRAQGFWNLKKSSLGPKLKEHLQEKLNLDKKDNLIINSQKTRSQKENKKIVIERINYLINQNLKIKRLRKKTKPTKASKERRIKIKKKVSQRKQNRKKIVDF